MTHELTLDLPDPDEPGLDPVGLDHGTATEWPGRPELRLAPGQPGVDLAAARRAAADFLDALGIDLDAEARRETPARMARAYAELLNTGPLR